jgi:hypothetical protein
MKDGCIYVWHCKDCKAQGSTNLAPPNKDQPCLLCGTFLTIETMIPLYLFD